jgi:hypothetical protein
MHQSNSPRANFPRGYFTRGFCLCAVSVLTALFAGPSLRAQDAVLSGTKVAAAETTSSGPTTTSAQAQTPSKKTSSKKSTASTDATAEVVTQPGLVIRGEEVPSAYGAPPGLSRSRFSNLVNAYCSRRAPSAQA